MSNFLDAIDKYKFGLIAALSFYVMVFVYLQMATYQAVVHYEPFHDGSYVEIPEEEIELKAENILSPENFTGDVKNTSRDVNDGREKTYNNDFSPNKTVADVEAEYKKLEQQMYEEAGGDKTREQIKKEMEARKQAELDAAQKNNKTAPTNTNSGDKVYAGNVMAEWELSGRTPHQNNEWYIRKPGYMCGKGSGRVMVLIKVNANGNVIEASYSSSQSTNANQCMIDNALKYAKMSRFNYSSSGVQSGHIAYVFVSQ